MVVTESSKRQRIGPGTWPDVVMAVAAALTLIGGIWGWQWLTGRDDGEGNATANPPAAPTTRPTLTTAPPARVDDVALSSLTPIGGRTVPLPADLDRTRFPDAVAIGCPSNQAGERTTVVKYQLFRRYRTLTAEVSGWSESKQPFRVQVQVVTTTVGRDGTPVHEPGQKQTPTVHGDPVRLTAGVTASGVAGRSGVGADELELHVACDQPHDVLILSDARLRG
jgi:hypothetical protein